MEGKDSGIPCIFGKNTATNSVPSRPMIHEYRGRQPSTLNLLKFCTTPHLENTSLLSTLWEHTRRYNLIDCLPLAQNTKSHIGLDVYANSCRKVVKPHRAANVAVAFLSKKIPAISLILGPASELCMWTVQKWSHVRAVVLTFRTVAAKRVLNSLLRFSPACYRIHVNNAGNVLRVHIDKRV